jgi:hypothetical protein
MIICTIKNKTGSAKPQDCSKLLNLAMLSAKNEAAIAA